MPWKKMDLAGLGAAGSTVFSVLESSTDCTKIIDLDGRILFMNANGCAIMELPGSQAVEGRQWLDLWPQSAQAQISAALAGAREGRSTRFQGDCPTAKGAPKHWDVAVSPILGSSGAVEAILATSRDLTETIRARREAEVREKAMRRQTAALKAAGVVAKLGGWEIDFRTGQVFWSDEIWSLLAGEPRDISLDEAMSIYRPQDRPWILERFDHARATGERVRFETEVIRFDGTRRWASIIGEPAFEDGVCTVLRGAAQDVTEARQAVEQLARTERRLSLAVEMANLHVYEVDYRAQRVISQGAEDTFFESPITFERMCQAPFSAVDPRDRELAEEAWRRSQAAGERFNTQYRVNRSDGKEIWAQSVAMIEHDAQGDCVRLVGALQNITDQKRAELDMVAAKEIAEAASAAKSAFLANMSHEIRTPLNGILGMAQVMARDELTDTQRERVRVIRDSGETLMAVLNTVLDLSKIEAGRMELDDHAFDLRRCLEAACRPFRDVAAQKDVALQLDLAPAADASWMGDEMRLRQIVGNLVSNAVKFTNQGSVRIFADVLDGRLVLKIVDSGVGIPADRVGQLFEKFTQVDDSATRRFGGTGLGLAICRDLVALMQGVIEVESREGEGTCFIVTLPLERLAAAAPAPAQAAEAASDAADRNLRILAAEDNPTNQLILRSLLEPLGAELTIVGNGRDAVAAVQAGCFDVILMDIQMPELDGVQAARRIREWEAGGGARATPIVALSANVLSHQTDEYRAVGMNGVVAKPIELGLLLAELDKVLSAAEDHGQEKPAARFG